jgi:hypothetical protein
VTLVTDFVNISQMFRHGDRSDVLVTRMNIPEEFVCGSADKGVACVDYIDGSQWWRTRSVFGQYLTAAMLVMRFPVG